MNVKIRKSKPQDFESIFSIWLASQSEYTGLEVKKSAVNKMKQLFLENFENKHAHFIVAESSEKEIVGWQSLLPLLSNPSIGKHVAQISSYVKEDIAGGLGIMLTEQTKLVAKKKGIEQIYAWVKKDNRAANLLALKLTKQKSTTPPSTMGNVPEFNIYVIDII